MKQIGEALRRRREEKNLTIQAVHAQTRIPVRFIEGLEAEDPSQFPAEVYFIGSLKRYAAFLGLSSSELLAQYRSKTSVVPVPLSQISQEKERQQQSDKCKKIDVEGQQPAPRVPLTYTLIVAVVVCALGALTYRVIRHQGGLPSCDTVPPVATAPDAVAVSTAAVPAPAPVPAPQAPDQLRLSVTGIDSSWVKVVADTTTVFQGTILKGDTRTWDAHEQYAVVIGYAPGVKVTLNGADINVVKGAVRDIRQMTLGWNDVKKSGDAR